MGIVQLESALAECARLREEHERLRRILKNHNVPLPQPFETTRNIDPGKPVTAPAAINHLSNSDLKIGLFRSLFRGREDVYAVQWESSNGRHGYPYAERWPSPDHLHAMRSDSVPPKRPDDDGSDAL